MPWEAHPSMPASTKTRRVPCRCWATANHNNGSVTSALLPVMLPAVLLERPRLALLFHAGSWP
eukprot:7738917-Lingulodinium_polyedra.AAC.1